MATTLNFTKIVVPHKLHNEIEEQVPEIVRVNVLGSDDVYIEFSITLDAGQIASVNSTVQAHIATDPQPIIGQLSDQTTNDFREIDYTILPNALHPVRTFNQGELVLVEWYTDDTLTTKVLKVDIVYTRDAFGYVTSRVTTRTWFNDDGSENPSKSIRVKQYDEVKKQSEIKTRRENNILAVQSQVLTYMVLTGVGGDPLVALSTGRAFIESLDAEVDKYIKSGSSQLVDAVNNNTTDTWLDNIVPGDVITIRDYMVAELTIA